MSYEPTKKFLIFSISAATLALVGIFFITWTLFGKISKINDEAKKTKEINVSVEQAFKIKSQLNELEPKIKRLDSAFVANNKEVEFIESVESLASSTGVKLLIQSISIDTKKQGFKEDMSVRLQAEGDREELVSFLGKLETMPKIVLVDKADLAKDLESWILRLEIIAYRLK